MNSIRLLSVLTDILAEYYREASLEDNPELKANKIEYAKTVNMHISLITELHCRTELRNIKFDDVEEIVAAIGLVVPDAGILVNAIDTVSEEVFLAASRQGDIDGNTRMELYPEVTASQLDLDQWIELIHNFHLAANMVFKCNFF